MSRNDLDNLLRDHLADELGPERGRAEAAFRRRVTDPMQRRLSVPKKREVVDSPWSNRMVVGFALAACVALGTVLPRFLAYPTHGPADLPSSDRIFDTTTAGDRNPDLNDRDVRRDQLLIPK